MTGAACRRRRTTGPLSISGLCLLTWATSTTPHVTFAAQAVRPYRRRLQVSPQACQEFYKPGEAAAAVGRGGGGGGDGNHSSGVMSAMSVSTPSSASPVFWQASDCMDVWAAWTRTLPTPLEPLIPDRRRLRERAAEMRQRGVYEVR